MHTPRRDGMLWVTNIKFCLTAYCISIPIWSRSVTGLCKSVRPWESLSDIQSTKKTSTLALHTYCATVVQRRSSDYVLIHRITVAVCTETTCYHQLNSHISCMRHENACKQSWVGHLCSPTLTEGLVFMPRGNLNVSSLGSEEHVQVNICKRSQSTSAKHRSWLSRCKAIPVLLSQHLHRIVCICWMYSYIEYREWVVSGSTWHQEYYIRGLFGHLQA